MPSSVSQTVQLRIFEKLKVGWLAVWLVCNALGNLNWTLYYQDPTSGTSCKDFGMNLMANLDSFGRTSNGC